MSVFFPWNCGTESAENSRREKYSLSDLFKNEPGLWRPSCGRSSLSPLGHRRVGLTGYFVRPPPPSRTSRRVTGQGTCVSGEPAGAAGTMESPFSPGLALRPDEDWGEWALRLCRAGSTFLPPTSAPSRWQVWTSPVGEATVTRRFRPWSWWSIPAGVCPGDRECKILPDWNYYRVWLLPPGKHQLMICCGEYDVIRKLRAGWPWPPKRLQGFFLECAVWAMPAVECLCVYVHVWCVWEKVNPFQSFHYWSRLMSILAEKQSTLAPDLSLLVHLHLTLINGCNPDCSPDTILNFLVKDILFGFVAGRVGMECSRNKSREALSSSV